MIGNAVDAEEEQDEGGGGEKKFDLSAMPKLMLRTYDRFGNLIDADGADESETPHNLVKF